MCKKKKEKILEVVVLGWWDSSQLSSLFYLMSGCHFYEEKYLNTEIGNILVECYNLTVSQSYKYIF